MAIGFGCWVEDDATPGVEAEAAVNAAVVDSAEGCGYPRAWQAELSLVHRTMAPGDVVT
jgi:hypothetical protein